MLLSAAVSWIGFIICLLFIESSWLRYFLDDDGSTTTEPIQGSIGGIGNKRTIS